MKKLQATVNLAKWTAPRDTRPFVYATSTKNGLRINGPGAIKIGVDYDLVNSDSEEEGVWVTVVATGKGDDRRLFITLSEEGNGAKLSSPQKKDSGSLQFSNAGIYTNLGGKPSDEYDKIITRKFMIGEPIIAQNDDGTDLLLADAIANNQILKDGDQYVDEDGEAWVPYYELTFTSEESRDKRGSGGSEESDDSDDDDNTVETADVEEGADDDEFFA